MVTLYGAATFNPGVIAAGAILYAGAALYEIIASGPSLGDMVAAYTMAEMKKKQDADFKAQQVALAQANALAAQEKALTAQNNALAAQTEKDVANPKIGKHGIATMATIATAARAVRVQVPADGSSRTMRDQIMLGLGFDEADIKRYDEIFPTLPGKGKPEGGGFFITREGSDKWATPEEVKSWPVNSSGSTVITVAAGTIAHLKRYYAHQWK